MIFPDGFMQKGEGARNMGSHRKEKSHGTRIDAERENRTEWVAVLRVLSIKNSLQHDKKSGSGAGGTTPVCGIYLSIIPLTSHGLTRTNHC